MARGKYTLDSEQVKIVCEWTSKLKFSDGYASNIAKLVDTKKPSCGRRYWTKEMFGRLDPDFHSFSSSSSIIHTTATSTLEATTPTSQFATKEYIDRKLASLTQSIEQSISQSLSQVLDAVKNKAAAPSQMLEDDYKTETEQEMDPYYEQRQRMKGKGHSRRRRM